MMDICVGGEWAKGERGAFYSGQGGALSMLTSWGRDGMTSPGERLLQDRSPRGVVVRVVRAFTPDVWAEICAHEDLRVEIPDPIGKLSMRSERPIGSNRLKRNELGQIHPLAFIKNARTALIHAR